MQESQTPLDVGTYNKQKMSLTLFILCSAFFGLVISVIIVLFLNRQLLPETSEPIVQEETDYSEYNPSGYLLMNFSAEDTQSKKLYTYDVVTRKLQEAPVNHMWPSEAANGKIGIGSRLFLDGGKTMSGLFTIDENSAEELMYATSTVDVLLSNPKVSSSGTLYTFAVAPKNQASLPHEERHKPSNWKIYLGTVGSDSEPRFIGNGPSALFSPDETQLLYLNNDGFHLYEIATGEDVAIPELATGQELTYVMADTSVDGTKLVLTSSPTQEVNIFDVVSWKPFKVELKQTFPILSYWPVFSPDGNYVALQQFDWVDGHPGNRRLTIIDLLTYQLHELGNLAQYTSTDFYISDWVSQ